MLMESHMKQVRGLQKKVVHLYNIREHKHFTQRMHMETSRIEDAS